MELTLTNALVFLAALMILVLAIGLVAGWRPGQGLPRSEDTVLREVRARSGLSDQDWRRVRMAVARGEAVAPPLRPAAHDLATELDALYRPWPRRRLLKTAVLGYVVLATAWLIALGPGWEPFVRPSASLIPAALAVWLMGRYRRRVRTAVEVNRP